jgi:hypothetical protein
LLATRGISVVMKNSRKNILPFPTPPEEPAASTIVVQIGNERFAIHWEIEDLPPAAPLIELREGGRRALSKIVK